MKGYNRHVGNSPMWENLWNTNSIKTPMEYKSHQNSNTNYIKTAYKFHKNN